MNRLRSPSILPLLLLIIALYAGLLGIYRPARAGVLSDYGENKVVDALIRAQSLGAPATWYIALYTDTCSDSASGTEVSTSSTGYARVGVTAGLTQWAGTQSAGSTSASSGSGGTTSNNATITFGTPVGNWGTVQSVGWTDASTAGNRWICINLTASKNVNNGDAAPTFPAGTLQFQIDN